MRIYLIIAIDKNGVMGKDNKLCWSLKEDLKHFKQETKNYPLIMGANTFNSLPGILPGREHLVLSSTLYGDENKSVFTSIKEVLDYCEESEIDKVYVIGGANIIKQFNKYNLFDELIITHVNTEIDVADTKIDIYEDLDFHKWHMYNSVKNDTDQIEFEIKRYIKKEKRFY
jgi:dihydrofolate reductase